MELESQWWVNPRLCLPCSGYSAPGVVLNGLLLQWVCLNLMLIERHIGNRGLLVVMEFYVTTGEILALFSGLLGSLDSVEAELRSIIKALQMVIDSRWSAAYRFIIESDSQAAISWCCSSTDRLWKYWDLLKLVDCSCTLVN
ncbi:hypothetical protein Gogos_002354 [Gossypium gossypioides]|uniref:RNase H type-1 domain-containing protein n=1 Tax=Gossypium gossypioides TaxID=34282 RepID=A0A7J9CR65_GOSGO|nr:hypothetical protein [Gossypium gossypioides]